MKQDGRDLLAQFRALAPERRPISLQRWRPRRIVYAAGIAAVQRARRWCNVYGMFTPAEPAIADEPACGTERRDGADGAVRPDGDRGPVRRVAARRLVAGRRARAARHGAGSGWTPTRPASTPSRSRCAPPGACPIDGASEVPTDEVGMRRFERPDRAPAGARAIRTTCSTGGCVTYRSTSTTTPNGSVDLRARRRARLPAASRSGRRGRRAHRAVAVRCRGAAVCRGALVIGSVSSRRLVAVVVGRVVAGVALAVVITIISLRLLGIRRGWGTALLGGLLGWGLAVLVALGLDRLGLGGRRTRPRTSSPSASRRRWPPR